MYSVFHAAGGTSISVFTARQDCEKNLAVQQRTQEARMKRDGMTRT